MDFTIMGSRMLRNLLAADGVKVGRLHASTLLKKMAIAGMRRRPNTANQLLGNKIYLY